jgi:cystathionine gamma-synthase
MWEDAAQALVFSSGMAAATAVVLALDPGDHIVAPTVMCWGLRHWLANEARRLGYAVDFVDTTDLSALAAALLPGRTKLVWLETPSNPLWTTTDIAAAADIAHAAGARICIDSTVATPVLTRPLTLRGRSNHARRDEVPERTFGCGGRRAGHRQQR